MSDKWVVTSADHDFTTAKRTQDQVGDKSTVDDSALTLGGATHNQNLKTWIWSRERDIRPLLPWQKIIDALTKEIVTITKCERGCKGRCWSGYKVSDDVPLNSAMVWVTIRVQPQKQIPDLRHRSQAKRCRPISARTSRRWYRYAFTWKKTDKANGSKTMRYTQS